MTTTSDSLLGFGERLYKDGFRNITNIDFSPVVIQEMHTKYASLDEMECMHYDYYEYVLIFNG